MTVRKVKGEFRGERHLFRSFERWDLYLGGKYADVTLRYREFDHLKTAQEYEPQVVKRDEEKTWWMFKEKFYVEDESLSSKELKALLVMKEQKRRKQIEKAMLYTESDRAALQTSSSNREPIPDEVKIFVWKRDGGRCVKCGSTKNLEYDHDIPLSKGGSNTARNIRLLCEKCNREKGGDLT